MISYYELLGMIKEDKAPNKIKVHLTSNPKIYKAVYDFGEFNYYTLYEEEIIDDDYKDYLSDSYFESMMFEKNIEILDKKKIPEKLSTWFSVETKQSKELNIEYANTNFENMYEKINSIIDYLKSKGDE